MPDSPSTTETDGKQDSYLKRYYRTLPEEKRLMIEKSLMDANNDQAHISGLKMDVSSQDPEKEANAGDNDPKEHKKSSTCIVL